MRRPWQIWLTLALCLAVASAAVGWLSLKALALDRAEAQAREQAALEENARLALWRMDSTMAALVIQESSRPYFVYQSFYTLGAAPGSTAPRGKQVQPVVPSTLLVEVPPQILVHFQFDAGGELTSPQAPCEADRQRALEFVPPQRLDAFIQRLDQVRQQITSNELLALLPPSAAAPDVVPLTAAAPQAQLDEDPPPQNSLAQNEISQSPSLQAQALQGRISQGPTQGRTARGPASETQQQSALQSPQQDGLQTQPQLARGNDEYNARHQYVAQTQNFSAQNMANNGVYNASVGLPATDGEAGAMTPLWIHDQLLLARRVTVSGRTVVQGCLLDWPEAKRQLLDSIGDLLPDADLAVAAATPAEEGARLLASLPIKLIPGAVSVAAETSWSPIRLSLFVAWSSMLLVAAALAALLQGVISLSERRAAFVSAVTHELRTPLTTFRMYAEMLSEGMVPDEEGRRRYLHTLHVEADRLMHLVENVLAYARLERGRPGGRVREMTVAELLNHATNRLTERAQHANLDLRVDVDEATLAAPVRADASAVEQILFNLVDNAGKYAALATDRSLHLEVRQHASGVRLLLRDHGPGVSAGLKRRLFQPFRKSADEAALSAPGVGLGLALSRRLAREMGGDLELDGNGRAGACFLLTLPSAT